MKDDLDDIRKKIEAMQNDPVLRDLMKVPASDVEIVRRVKRATAEHLVTVEAILDAVDIFATLSDYGVQAQELVDFFLLRHPNLNATLGNGVNSETVIRGLKRDAEELMSVLVQAGNSRAAFVLQAIQRYRSALEEGQKDGGE